MLMPSLLHKAFSRKSGLGSRLVDALLNMPTNKQRQHYKRARLNKCNVHNGIYTTESAALPPTHLNDQYRGRLVDHSTPWAIPMNLLAPQRSLSQSFKLERTEYLSLCVREGDD